MVLRAIVTLHRSVPGVPGPDRINHHPFFAPREEAGIKPEPRHTAGTPLFCCRLCGPLDRSCSSLRNRFNRTNESFASPRRFSSYIRNGLLENDTPKATALVRRRRASSCKEVREVDTDA